MSGGHALGSHCTIVLTVSGTFAMEIKLTAVFRKFSGGYGAFVEKLPDANTPGKTPDEARENLKEAVAMVLQANRELAEESQH